MKFAGKMLSSILIVAISLSMSACSKANKNKANDNTKHIEQALEIKKIDLPPVVVMAHYDELDKLFSVKELNFQEVGKMNKSNIVELEYDKDKNVYVFVINDKDKSGKNIINIKSKSNDIVLNKSAKYLDVKLSKDASKILFRSFKDNSSNNPEGMRVYDIEKNKEIKLNTKVLVSGNIYTWLDEENIIYYGIIPEKAQSGKIYKYNLKSQQETVYLDNLKGYCISMCPISKSSIVVLKNIDEEYSLCYYNVENGEEKVISKNITDMEKFIVDKEKNILYAVGKSIEGDNAILFSVNLSTFEISQLTYDLPKNVDVKAGLALDEKGNVIFAGTDSDKNNDIYVYDVNNKATTLITERSNNYKIYKNN